MRCKVAFCLAIYSRVLVSAREPHLRERDQCAIPASTCVIIFAMASSWNYASCIHRVNSSLPRSNRQIYIMWKSRYWRKSMAGLGQLDKKSSSVQSASARRSEHLSVLQRLTSKSCWELQTVCCLYLVAKLRTRLATGRDLFQPF